MIGHCNPGELTAERGCFHFIGSIKNTFKTVNIQNITGLDFLMDILLISFLSSVHVVINIYVLENDTHKLLILAKAIFVHNCRYFVSYHLMYNSFVKFVYFCLFHVKYILVSLIFLIFKTNIFQI